MLDQALNLLTLYIIWKSRGLTSAPEPSPEEISFREKLKEARDTLLDKLLEFAIGTQSNTSETVRRAVSRSVSCPLSWIDELMMCGTRRSKT